MQHSVVAGEVDSSTALKKQHRYILKPSSSVAMTYFRMSLTTHHQAWPLRFSFSIGKCLTEIHGCSRASVVLCQNFSSCGHKSEVICIILPPLGNLLSGFFSCIRFWFSRTPRNPCLKTNIGNSLVSIRLYSRNLTQWPMDPVLC